MKCQKQQKFAKKEKKAKIVNNFRKKGKKYTQTISKSFNRKNSSTIITTKDVSDPWDGWIMMFVEWMDEWIAG